MAAAEWAELPPEGFPACRACAAGLVESDATVKDGSEVRPVLECGGYLGAGGADGGGRHGYCDGKEGEAKGWGDSDEMELVAMEVCVWDGMRWRWRVGAAQLYLCNLRLFPCPSLCLFVSVLTSVLRKYLYSVLHVFGCPCLRPRLCRCASVSVSVSAALCVSLCSNVRSCPYICDCVGASMCVGVGRTVSSSL